MHIRTALFLVALAIVPAYPAVATAQQAQHVLPGSFTYTTAGKMSAYRNLAQYAYQAYLDRDDETAAILGGIIESSWDKGESALEKASPEVYKNIDITMDNFIKPLKYYKKAGRPDAEKERKAFDSYLAALAAAD